MDTRDLLPIDDISNCKPDDFLKDVIGGALDVSNEDIAQQIHIIPSFVPPLRLKPILSNKYIELWSKSAEWVKDAEHIIVVGYSFNTADEHFNDILRCFHKGKKVDIIAPDAGREYFKARMEKVFGVPVSQFTKTRYQNIEIFKARNIRLIPAKATKVDISHLFNS